MSRSCQTRDDRLIAFAAGVEETLDLDLNLDAHIETCDECQAFLAELWEGGLDHDLVEPIVAAIRLELFLIDAAKLGGGIVADMTRALLRYLDPGLGKEES